MLENHVIRVDPTVRIYNKNPESLSLINGIYVIINKTNWESEYAIQTVGRYNHDIKQIAQIYASPSIGLGDHLIRNLIRSIVSHDDRSHKF